MGGQNYGILISMQEYEKLLDELAGLAGIIPEYYDIFGKKHVISKESKVAILSGYGPAGRHCR